MVFELHPFDVRVAALSKGHRCSIILAGVLQDQIVEVLVIIVRTLIPTAVSSNACGLLPAELAPQTCQGHTEDRTKDGVAQGVK